MKPLPIILGLAIGLSSACGSPVGQPLYAPADGSWDRAAIMDLLKDRHGITSYTPELEDFMNEFYAAIGHHDELDGLNIEFMEDVGDDKGKPILDQAKGSFQANDGYPYIEIEMGMPLGLFLYSFLHEVVHQYDIDEPEYNNHKKTAVAEVAKPMMLYGFDVDIGQLVLHLPAFNLKPEGYVPIFWNFVRRSGEVRVPSRIINATSFDELDEIKREVTKKPYHEEVMGALDSLRESKYLGFNAAASPPQIDYLIEFLEQKLHTEEQKE